jgi:hypothetical protein
MANVPSELQRLFSRGNPGNNRLGTPLAVSQLKKGMLDMTKTVDRIVEAIANSNHPFRKTDNHPKKAQKHRYERRKVREYLHLGDWGTEEPA